jgi:uncharacterized repeat protein (TIGR01451 family)
MCPPRFNLAIAVCPIILLGIASSTRASDFGRPAIYPVGSGPQAVVVGDFNGDGKPDLAVLNGSSRSVSILLGNGNGTFESARNFDVGGDNPTSIVVADFNGDGKLDLAAAIPGNIPAPPTTFPTCTQSSVNLMLGNGDGTFQVPRRAVMVDSAKLSITGADLSGDGKIDLVARRGQNDPACPLPAGNIFLGVGDGSFTALPNPVPDTPVVVGDFNGDGKPDLAAFSTELFGSGSILLGNGDGTFQPPLALPVPSRCGAFCRQIFPAFATADFNGDGKLDIALERGSKKCIEYCDLRPYTLSTLVMLGNGDGTFQAPTTAGPGGYFLLIDDFNGDGKPDILASPTIYAGNSLFYVLLGKGDGTFPSTFDFEIGSSPDFLAAVDLNGDKLPDIISANLAEATIGVMLNTTATSGSDLSARISAAPEPVSVTQNLTYTVQAINSGPNDASNFVLKNTLPTGVNFVSATANQGSCIQTNLVVTCKVSMLVSGDSLVAVIVVVPTTTGSVSDTAIASATETDTIPENSQASHSTRVDPMFTVTVTKSGAGTGVISDWQGNLGAFNCGITCTVSLPTGTPVFLRAIPDSTSVFGGWGAACSGLDLTCYLTMNANKNVSATFDQGPNFLLSVDASGITVVAGGSMTTNITVTPEPGPTATVFNSAIAFTCSVTGPAPTPKCSFAPSSLTPGANPASSLLTITAPPRSAALALPQTGTSTGTQWYAAWLPPLALLGCLWATGFDKKRRGKWVLSFLVLTAAILPSACGSGGSSTPPPPVSYMVTVRATSGALQHSTVISVTVQ